MLLLFPPKPGMGNNFSIKNHKIVGEISNKTSNLKIIIIIKKKTRKWFVNVFFNLKY